MEPYLFLIPGRLEEPAYCEIAPVEFKNPVREMSMIPITPAIRDMQKDFYTEDEIKENPDILKAARTNTARNHMRKNTDNDFISIRSSKSEIPCAAAFMLKSKDKLFNALDIDINDYYIMFVTPDEVMLADKSKFKPAQIKRVMSNIKNKVASLFPDKEEAPILATEVFEYDYEKEKYVEV